MGKESAEAKAAAEDIIEVSVGTGAASSSVAGQGEGPCNSEGLNRLAGGGTSALAGDGVMGADFEGRLEREDDAREEECDLLRELDPLERGVVSDREEREGALGEKVAGVGLSKPSPLGPGDAAPGEPELACMRLAPDELAVLE